MQRATERRRGLAVDEPKGNRDTYIPEHTSQVYLQHDLLYSSFHRRLYSSQLHSNIPPLHPSFHPSLGPGNPQAYPLSQQALFLIAPIPVSPLFPFTNPLLPCQPIAHPSPPRCPNTSKNPTKSSFISAIIVADIPPGSSLLVFSPFWLDDYFGALCFTFGPTFDSSWPIFNALHVVSLWMPAKSLMLLLSPCSAIGYHSSSGFSIDIFVLTDVP
ncbi:hypothetical protein C8J56DRAFT_1065691 [Mycena floridula]|nr:hypothetical protein C8J56DRAFT_1065691 [Mycena floridula]